MSEVKDPAIKLFGKTIPLLLPNQQLSCVRKERKTHAAAADYDDDHHHPMKQHHSSISSPPTYRVEDEQENCKKSLESEITGTIERDDPSHRAFEELKDPQTPCENPKTPPIDDEPNSPKPSHNEDQSETNNSQEKTLKKPDKILPCPRCNSMDTKFCYYNNYNVNQPRHFCKNCQRYWTSGGTMRSVPVGSGRRKNKSCSGSQFRHMMVLDSLQAARGNVANGIHYPGLGTEGSVLSFGSDSVLCESQLTEKSQKCVEIDGLCGGSENGDRDQTSRSSDSAEGKGRKGNSVFQESVMVNFPCFVGRPPWPFPMPPPTLGASGFPFTFCPAPPYWGCSTLPGSWNVAWVPPPLSSPDSTIFSGPHSPTLGKHSRDEETFKEEPSKENKSERGIWIPKTLRIDDPNEAAKSSIWSTLGIKNEMNDSIRTGGGLFKAFQSKGEEREQKDEQSMALQANPAALYRSFNFHESVCK